jgi:HemY protein
MKRHFLLGLVLLFLGAWLGLAILRDPGYVLISWRLTSVEMSLWLGLCLWLLSLVGTAVLADMLFKLVGMPGWIGQWRATRRLRRSLEAFAKGSQLAELGEWRRAERLLAQAAALSPEPLPAWLAAARAAARQHAFDRAEKYLVLAEEKSNRRAVEIARARLLLTAGHWESAASLLRRLYDNQKSDESVGKLLVEALARLQKWGELADLLPTLMRKAGFRDDPEFARLEKRANTEILGWIAHSGSRVDREFTRTRLRDYWQALPKRLRTEDELLAAYAGQLIRISADDEAEALLAEALEKQWSNAAVELYGRACSTRPDAALARAEGWKGRHPHNPALMLTLGRLCLQNRRWGDAKVYFEASLGLRKSTEAYGEMIRLLSQSGDREANRYVIEGLAHMAARLPDLPLP